MNNSLEKRIETYLEHLNRDGSAILPDGVFHLNLKKDFFSKYRLEIEQDDEKGYLVWRNGNSLNYRYKSEGCLGRGSFGEVISALDYKSNRQVAIKILRKGAKTYKTAFEEISKLLTINCFTPTNIVEMINFFSYRRHPCIVFEKLATSLREVMYRNRSTPLPLIAIKTIVRDLLTALETLKTLKVVHSDFKLDNIVLIKPESYNVKLIDFGASWFINDKSGNLPNIQYRAPEIIFGLPYGFPIDVWGLGCALIELCGHRMLPGENTAHQIAVICDVIRCLPIRIVKESSSGDEYFRSMRPTYISQKSFKEVISEIVKRYDCKEFEDFINQLLKWDPVERLTPQQALFHEWLQF